MLTIKKEEMIKIENERKTWSIAIPPGNQSTKIK